MTEDKKGGFSGLSGLVSDVSAKTSNSQEPSESSRSPVDGNSGTFDLIELTRWPSMPAPWSSEDDGEVFIWGDFFLTFQKHPVTVLELTSEITEVPDVAGGMTYLYAILAFYRLDRNPHGPSHRPILAAGLEQADYRALAKLLGSEADALLESSADIENPPIVRGLFLPDTRLNLGQYEGRPDREAVKKELLSIVENQLRLKGSPKSVGRLENAFGHPETGLPRKKSSQKSARTQVHTDDISEGNANDQPKAASSDSGGSSGKKIFWITMVILFLVFMANLGDESSRSTKQSPGTIIDADSAAVPRPLPSAKTTASTELSYTKPRIGNDLILPVDQIRWCLRESIRIETVRDFVTGDGSIDAFNSMVSDYNARCGSYRYYENAMSRAKREIESVRSDIAKQARASLLSSSKAGAGSVQAKNVPSKTITREAQNLLTQLGYSPGPIDGIYGKNTVKAVKEFQATMSLKTDGWIDADLLELLRSVVEAQSAVRASERPRPQAYRQKNSGAVPNAAARGNYFTRGSSKDDLIRIQGRPTSIQEMFDDEWWYYGYSKVVISRRSNTVISWDNSSGNLKVRYLPENVTTADAYYTRGSSKDDVLRLQGTPKSIQIMFDDEWWYYKYSKVVISRKSNTVTSWDNSSGNLKVRYVPGNRTTQSSFYSRGSHKDDVLRLQGTPKSIEIMFDDEWWYYGYSKVVISRRTGAVTSWDNSSGNLRVR